VRLERAFDDDETDPSWRIRQRGATESRYSGFIDAHQANPQPLVWTKSADEILAGIARFAQQTADAWARN
jgi:hypothetical protein